MERTRRHHLHGYQFRIRPNEPRQVEYRSPKSPDWQAWGYYETGAEAAQKVQEYSSAAAEGVEHE